MITCTDVSFSYDTPYVPVLADISLSIDPSWRLAVVGRNGSGKTTLVRLLTGALLPTTGTVTNATHCCVLPTFHRAPDGSVLDVMLDVAGPYRRLEDELAAAAAYMADDVAAVADYTAVFDRYEALGGWSIREALAERAATLGLSAPVLQRPFHTLSGGERTRALLAAIQAPARAWPILDEPTNHLDADGRRAVREALRQRRGGFLMVSHDEDLLEACCDHVLSLEADGVHLIHADYVTWKRERDAQEEREHREQANNERLVADLRRAATERRQWSDTREAGKDAAADSGFESRRAAKIMKRALHSERRADEALAQAEGLLQRFERNGRLVLPPPLPAPAVVMQIDAVTIERRNHCLVHDRSFSVRRGQRLAITGPNGAGKSSLLEVLLGEPPAAGQVHRPANLVCAVSRQWPRWTSGLLHDHCVASGIDVTRFRLVCAALGVRGDIGERPLETFSMGQWKKLDLARTLVEPCHCLVWDEPTNGLDPDSVEQLADVLAAGSHTMIVVDHHRRFLDRIATDVIELGGLPAAPDVCSSSPL